MICSSRRSEMATLSTLHFHPPASIGVRHKQQELVPAYTLSSAKAKQRVDFWEQETCQHPVAKAVCRANSLLKTTDPQNSNVCRWLYQCGISCKRRLHTALAEPVAHFFNGLLTRSLAGTRINTSRCVDRIRECRYDRAVKFFNEFQCGGNHAAGPRSEN